MRRGSLTRRRIARRDCWFLRASRESRTTSRRSCALDSRVPASAWVNRISRLRPIVPIGPTVLVRSMCMGQRPAVIVGECVPSWLQNGSSWAPSCVARMDIGGVGGRRILGVTPEPAQWAALSVMVRDHRSVRRLLIEFADVNGGASDRLAQPSKPLPVGGEIEVYASGQGARAPLSGAAAKKYESAGVSAKV